MESQAAIVLWNPGAQGGRFMRKVLFTFAFVVSGPISAMALSEPTPAPAADDADQAVRELFEQPTEQTLDIDSAADAFDVDATTTTEVETAPAEAPQSPEPAVQEQQVEPQQPVVYQQQQPRRYYYYQQQPKPGFFSRMMELERRKNRFLLRMIGIRRD